MALSANEGATHGAGLRLVARESVIEVGHDEPALIMLLLAPVGTLEKKVAIRNGTTGVNLTDLHQFQKFS